MERLARRRLSGSGAGTYLKVLDAVVLRKQVKCFGLRHRREESVHASLLRARACASCPLTSIAARRSLSLTRSSAISLR